MSIPSAAECAWELRAPRPYGPRRERYGIQLSVHMPYFINLAVEDEEKKKKNLGDFVDSLKVAEALGAKRAVFHPGSASGGNRGRYWRGPAASLRR